MHKTITIHQPEFLPWVGFFDRIIKSDVFVILDDVGYQKNGFINRNKIKTVTGAQWLTIPVVGRSPNLKINEVLIDNTKDWAQKNWSLLQSAYYSSPFFGKYKGFFEELYNGNWNSICEFDSYIIENVIKMLGMEKIIKRSSEMNVAGIKTERLVNICKQLGGDVYLSGPGGKDYMDLSKFEKENIKVIFQEFTHPEYPQMFMENGFVPYMSIIDLLFNCGEESFNIISKAGK